MRLESPLFLITALVWVLAFAMVGSWFWKLVTAIMRVFPIAPALVLAAAMLWALPGLAEFLEAVSWPEPRKSAGWQESLGPMLDAVRNLAGLTS